MLGSRKFLIFLLSCLVICSVFVIGLSAEDLVREDPLLTPDGYVSVRSASRPEYILTANAVTQFGQWLYSEGYTSSSNLFFPADIIYRCLMSDPTSGIAVQGGLYFDGGSGHIRVYIYSGGSSSSLEGYTLAFDSAALYDFFINEVGVSESDFIYRDAPSSIFAFAVAVFSSILGVGSQLVSFVIARPIALIPIVAMVFVLGYGVIRRLVKGV